jgi:hypothetical protein
VSKFSVLAGAKTQALGRSRGGLTTKIHMLCDGLGRPLRFMLTAGQRHDNLTAKALLEGFKAEGRAGRQGL